MVELLKKSRRGMTVIEVLVAMAVFGVISVPLMGIFLDSMVATKLAQDKIETNALIGVVKDSVTKNIKYKETIYDLTGSAILLNDISGSAIITTTGSAYNLKIKDKKNNISARYKFDAVRTQDFGTVSCSSISGPAVYPDTCEYLIIIRNIYNNIAIQKFKVFINRVGDTPITH